MNRPLLLLSALAASALPASASAQLEACDNLYVSGAATCEVQVDGGCMAQCEPVAFRAVCAADLYVDCTGECTAEADVSCTASCDVSTCEAACTVDPGSFDCEADCRGGLEARCAAECGGDLDEDARAQCTSSCRATVVGECRASCDAVPPSADCSARCEASCEASCQADARLDCQVDCQADGYVDCQASIEGGCEAQCMDPQGALFCDGQFIEASDIDACIDAIRAELAIEVDTSSRASCDDGSCMAEASVSCAASPGAPAAPGVLLVAMAGLALGVRRRS